MNSAPRLSTAVTLSIVAFVGVIACLVTFLIWTNHDPSNLISFLVAIVPATVGVILVGSRVDKVAETAGQIQESVNGKLDEKFSAIHLRLDTLDAAVKVNTATLATVQTTTNTIQEATTTP